MKITNFFVPLLIAAFAVVSVSAITDNPANDFQPVSDLIMTRPEGAPAITALSALYAPAQEKQSWIDLVCSGMTDGGCDYFKTNLADPIWDTQANHDGTSAGYSPDNTTDIVEGTQVWKASLTVFDKPKRETTEDVFLLVERKPDGFWYLDRILYGPGIAIQEK